jgi:ribosomal protein L7/L12
MANARGQHAPAPRIPSAVRDARQGLRQTRLSAGTRRLRIPCFVLNSAGDKMITVIKEVRALTGLGLKEAKDLVDGAPAIVLRVPDVAMAHAARTILESAGATVSITDPAS